MGIYRRPDSPYWWYVFYHEESGRKARFSGSTGATDKRVAQEVYIHKRNSHIRDEVRGRPPEIRFREWVPKYWDLHGQTLRAKETVRSRLKRILAAFGDKCFQDISTVDIQRFYNELLKVVSPLTANHYLALIRSIFNRAKAWGDFVGENPVRNVRKQKVPGFRLRFLSREEMERLLSVCDQRIRPILMCALTTGMRLGEIGSLTWERVDLDTDTIYILESKSGKPREIPVSPSLRKTLLELGPGDAGLVFRVPRITLRRLFQRTLKAAKIQGFRFHDLRHTFASHFIMKTADLPALQAILGHQSPVMTQRYAHLAKSHLARNMQIFDTAIPRIGSAGRARVGAPDAVSAGAR